MPYGTNLTLIGMYIIDEESSGDKLLIKKKIKKYNFYCQRYRDPNLKHSQFRVLSYYYSPERFLLKVITSLCTSISNYKLSLLFIIYTEKASQY